MNGQKSKPMGASVVEIKHPDESSDTLSGKTPKDWAETDEETPAQPMKQSKDSAMVFPSIMKRRNSYTMVPNKGSPANLTSNKDPKDIFSPKTEFDEKVEKPKGRKFVFPTLKNRHQNRHCVTENADVELEPFELEKIKQLEMANEEDVEDRKKIEEARFLNSKFNIQSPVHHKLGNGNHFEYPTANESAEILHPPVRKLSANSLYRPVEEASQGTGDSQE